MKMRRASQPDTPADLVLKDALTAPEKKGFVVIAGAGSGKTTSLVKALATIVEAHGVQLKKHRQRIACITYTDIAAGEIWADVGNNPLIHVSTIHSFLWTLIRTFQADLRQWVESRIDEKLQDLRRAADNFGPRVQQRTREKNRRDIERYHRDRERIRTVRSFSYSVGPNYGEGQLGHDDILKIGTQFLSERPLLRTLLAQQFPFLFVDESQDTTSGVVDALKAVEAQVRKRFCLGFFGDPMQRIYMTGVGAIPAEDGWLNIPKPENFRCPRRVLNVANAIRRDGDDLVQTRGRTIVVDGQERVIEGTARIFVLPADRRRQDYIALVRRWISRMNDDPAWEEGGDGSVKILVIVHRMAAVRLGFGSLYAAMNDGAPDSFKNGFLDATAWPLRPFVSFAIPLSDAIARGDEFAAISILRMNCPLLSKDALPGKNVAKVLASVRAASLKVEELMRPGSRATCRDVLIFLRDSSLLNLDPRLLAYLDDRLPPADDRGEEDNEGEATQEMTAMDALLLCGASEFWGYRQYFEDQSPFSTQQGIKGAEFERVLVIVDDEEGTHTQFSYDKYFGIKPLSERDIRNIAEGKETVVDRTRRLFYVCCTRALSDLAVVLFSEDAGEALACVRAADIFPRADIHTLADIN